MCARPGIPADCAALVERLSADGATLSLVNLGKQTRNIVVQVIAAPTKLLFCPSLALMMKRVSKQHLDISVSLSLCLSVSLSVTLGLSSLLLSPHHPGRRIRGAHDQLICGRRQDRRRARNGFHDHDRRRLRGPNPGTDYRTVTFSESPRIPVRLIPQNSGGEQ